MGKLVINKEKGVVEMGFRIKNSLWGLGCVYNMEKQELLQAGYYIEGVPRGFAFTGHGTQNYSIDFYD